MIAIKRMYTDWVQRYINLTFISCSVKKLKFADASSQCKELQVVINKLPQHIVNCYLNSNLPRTPSKKQVKQVYLHGRKVNIIIPKHEKSPHKKLFPEASTLLSSPGGRKDDEAENMLNPWFTKDKTLYGSGETTVDVTPIENDDDDNMFETFLDQGVENNNSELSALKEISAKMEDGNPLQGLFEKTEQEEELQEGDSVDQYPSAFDDALQLFSPSSFFGDDIPADCNEMSSNPSRDESEANTSKQLERHKTKEKYAESDSSYKVWNTKYSRLHFYILCLTHDRHQFLS